jgi:hypothetical protein
MNLESEQKDQLYTALAQAQVEFPTIRVNRKAFKNEYADLYAMLKPVYPILMKYGLSVHEWSGYINEIHCYGVRLAHKSGQYTTNAFPFVYDAPKPSDQLTHKIAGSQTYFFRYYVKGILGLMISDDPEDDDGQGHTTPLDNRHPVQHLVGSDHLTKEQLEQIEHVLKGHPEIAQKVLSGFNINFLAHIPKDQYLKTIDRIQILKSTYESLKK